MQVNQSRAPTQSPPLSSYSSHYPSVLITQGPVPEAVPVPQNPRQLSQAANPKPAYLTSHSYLWEPQ